MTSFDESSTWSEDQYREYFGPEDDSDDVGFELMSADEVEVFDIEADEGSAT